MTRKFGFLVIGLAILFMGSCKKDEDPSDPQKQNEPEPPVLNKPIVNSFSIASDQAIDIFGTVSFKFALPIKKSITLNNTQKDILYRPIFDNATIEGIVTQLVWSADSLEVKLVHKETFTPNQNYTLSTTSHWEEYKSGSWVPVVWQGKEVIESKTLKFRGGNPLVKIEDSNIVYEYPIPFQYHFFLQETVTGFIRLVIGQPYLFDANSENRIEFSTPTAKQTESATYNSTKNQIEFKIPAGLQNETIYTVAVIHKDKSTTIETTLHQYSIRTSKFNNFGQKIASFNFTAPVLRGLAIPWEAHYLIARFNSAEYFDDFELQTKTESFVSVGTTYNFQYSSNLIQFEAILSGNDWYDKQINPLVYAPWTDPAFKPVVSRDTTLAGFPPKRAMYISDGGGGKLTLSQVQQNTAEAILITGSSRIFYLPAPAMLQDFLDYQQQVVNKYPSLQNVPARESNVIWSNFPKMLKGIYKYKMKYVLPDGRVTSVYDFSLDNPVE